LTYFRRAALAAALALAAASGSADTIKVGVIAPFSGPFAIWGKQFQEAIEVYQARNGDKAGDHTVELIYRDSGGPNPDAAKSLAQELLIRDQVDYLAGFVFTPNALAVAPLIDRAETPTVIFNAATSRINAESPFFVRTGFTLWQVSVPMANWASAQGVSRVVTAVSDYGPGLDAEAAFTKAFTDKGGAVVDSIRMPLQTTDFAPFMQRIKDSGADAVFGFLPAGPPTYAFTKAYNENGLRAAGITFLGTGETDETTLEALGDAAIGLNTAYHYSAAHPSAENDAFKAALAELHPGSVPNLASVGAYDGMHLIYAMIAAAGSDGPAAIAAAKGLAWESPRGPVSIDPDSRHITQNVYIREVARDPVLGLINREIETIPDQPDHGWMVGN
jgi:branched-chain amino acid transport system substrate-binding protein